jgi:hypothetical protein
MFSAPTAGYVFLISGAALTLLVLAAVVAPGCSGPPSTEPCDYVTKFKEGAASFRGHSRHLPIEVLDQGSSVYVQQFSNDPGVLLHTPGAVIDKRSCRVCQVDGYSTAGRTARHLVLATYPPEQPLLR